LRKKEHNEIGKGFYELLIISDCQGGLYSKFCFFVL